MNSTKIRKERKRKHQKVDDTKSLYSNIEIGSTYYTKNQVLGMGSFGIAMVCYVNPTNESCVVKIVNLDQSKHKSPEKILGREVEIFKELSVHKLLLPHLVQMYALTKFRNKENHLCHALVMEYAGQDLDKILASRNEYSFRPAQLFEIGLHLLPALEAMHRCGVVHQDIKPENIVLKLSRRNSIFQVRLIDYGLAVRWDPHHKPHRKNRGAGTPRFCAWKQHLGHQGSPAMDMEAFLYSLIYLSGKKFPWSNLNISDAKLRSRSIAYLKRDANPQPLCAHLDHPTQDLSMASLLEQIRVVGYSTFPEYEKFCAYFKASLARIERQPNSTNSLLSNTLPSPCPKKQKLPPSPPSPTMSSNSSTSLPATPSSLPTNGTTPTS